MSPVMARRRNMTKPQLPVNEITVPVTIRDARPGNVMVSRRALRGLALDTGTAVPRYRDS